MEVNWVELKEIFIEYGLGSSDSSDLIFDLKASIKKWLTQSPQEGLSKDNIIDIIAESKCMPHLDYSNVDDMEDDIDKLAKSLFDAMKEKK